MNWILAAIVGAFFGRALIHYQDGLAARRDLMPVGIRLAALAIRARQEVLNQFVTGGKGPWIPDALARQKYLLDDLEKLMDTAQGLSGELHVLLWTARDALESNMTVLSSWQDRHEPALSVDHIGPNAPSHLDLYAVAHCLTLAVRTIPDRSVRNNAQRLAHRISDLRREASETIKTTVELLQKRDERARSDWVLTGRKLL